MNIELDSKDLDSIVARVAEIITPLLTAPPTEDVIFDVEGLSGYLRVTKQWVYERVHSNAIPHYKVGKYPRFRKCDIDTWLLGLRRGPKMPNKALEAC